MKFFGILFILILAALMESAVVVAYDEVDPALQACKHTCVNLPNNPVCGTGKATYRNECEMKCENADLIHPGKCEINDLMGNHGIIN